MDRGKVCWTNPSNSKQKVFFVATRSVADNKDANLEAGKIAAGGIGKLRCKHCDGDITGVGASKYTTHINDITFQTLLSRVETNQE